MRSFYQKFRQFFLNAGIFSVFINIALLAPSLYMIQVFDRVLTSRSNATLLMLTLVILFTLLLSLALDYLRTLLLVRAGLAVDRLLGEKVIAALIQRGSQLNRIEELHGLRDVATLRAFLSGPSIIALFDMPWMLFYLPLIFFFHPLLGAVACVGGLILFGLAAYNEKVNRPVLAQAQLAARKSSHLIDQGVANVDAINAMGMRSNFVGRWNVLNEQVLNDSLYTSERMGAVSSITRFMRQTIQVVMTATGAYLVVDQHMSAGIMIACTILLGRALAPFESLIGNWNNFVQARLAFSRLEEYFDSPLERVSTELPEPKGQLSLENISLVNRVSEQVIVRQVSIQLAAGESLAIIGPSASGKSSLARMILGIWHPSSGVVRLDGADISQIDRDRIGRHIGFLPQDVELFPGTIAENIARMAPVDSQQVVAAAMLAHVHELILQLPKGYDTYIGPGGHILSGGQMQRIGLARALYGSPCLVVLDEPNANLDSEGEACLLQTLQTLRERQVTVILITHKTSVLKLLDKILVMRAGRMEMFGPRQGVLEKLRELRGMPRISNQTREAGVAQDEQ